RALPQDLAVLVEASEEALGAVGENRLRFGIAREVGPTHTAADDVYDEDVEAFFPEKLAGVGIQAKDALLFVGADVHVIDQVDAFTHDERRRARAVGRLPEQVFLVGPLLGQVALARNAVLFRAAPVQPITRERG